jgi:hypothetical protein
VQAGAAVSRLDSFLRRLQAQRDCLNAAVGRMAARPGPVFELGLGNGRTYDHLREACPEREVYVFERTVSAHPSCVPDPQHLFEGPLESTLEDVRERFAGEVVLVHADLGSGRPRQDAETAALLSGKLPVFLAPGAIVVSDQELDMPGASVLPLPPGVQRGRYFMYRWPTRSNSKE